MKSTIVNNTQFPRSIDTSNQTSTFLFGQTLQKRMQPWHLIPWHYNTVCSLSSSVWAQTPWTDCRTHAIDWTLQGSNSSLPAEPDGVSLPLVLYCHQPAQLISPIRKNMLRMQEKLTRLCHFRNLNRSLIWWQTHWVWTERETWGDRSQKEERIQFFSCPNLPSSLLSILYMCISVFC